MPSIFPSTLFDRRFNVCFVIIFAVISLLYLAPVSYSFLPSPKALVSTPEQHDWLIATISPALAQRRRNMIRTTWQSLYTGPPATFRFVLANAGEQWMPLIQHENATYGDLIMLDHLTESKELGMRTKELEFMQWLVQNNQQFKYISKLDDDSYLDASAFYEKYLSKHLLPALPPADQDPKIIGRLLGRGGSISLEFPFPYPGGQFYTMSWPIVCALAHQYNTSTTRHNFADVLIGMLLDEAGTSFQFIDMPHREAFELREGEMDEQRWEHDITDSSMNPHLLKEDEVFMRVAGEMKSIRRQRDWWKDEGKWDWARDRDRDMRGRNRKERNSNRISR